MDVRNLDRSRILSLDRSTFVAIFVTLVAGAAAYRMIHWWRIEQSAALFVGLPTFLAIIVAVLPRNQKVLPIALSVVTLGLLLAGPIFGERVVDILIVAPLYYAVASVVAVLIDRERSLPRLSLALLPIALLSLEGVSPRWAFPRAETVTAERLVDAPAEQIQQALGETPHFERELPFFLRLGFPTPVGAEGEGLAPGDQRTIRFGANAAPLLVQVAATRPGYARFQVVEDHTPMAHWLRLRGAEVRWLAASPTHTHVWWTLHYDRLLDPAWYFRAWQSYAVGLAADYLIDTAAHP